MSEAMRRFGLKLNESTQYIESLQDELRETKLKLKIAQVGVKGIQVKLSAAIDIFYLDKDVIAFRKRVQDAVLRYSDLIDS